MPGSRQSEVSRLSSRDAQGSEDIEKKIKPIQFVLPLADTLDVAFVSRIIAGIFR